MSHRRARKPVRLASEVAPIPTKSVHLQAAIEEMKRLYLRETGTVPPEWELEEAIRNLGGFLRILVKWDREQKENAAESVPAILSAGQKSASAMPKRK